MADADVQGMLIRIEATTAQLRQEIARGDAAVAQSAGSIDASLGKIDSGFDRTGSNAGVLQRAVSAAFTGIGLASAAAVAGLVAITVKTTNYAQEVKNLSSLSKASVTEFQRFAVGAKSVGIEQDKLGDIFKDTTDRVGEFLQRGGGEMADFFKEIAPKVGVTAQMFAKLSGPEALQLYYTSLEKAGLSQTQMTTYMEAMADEATGLIPLLKNNGAGFKEFGDQAERSGQILKSFEIDQLVAVNRSIQALEGSFEGASRQLVLGMLPGIQSVTDRLTSMSSNGAMEALGTGVGFLADHLNILAAVMGGKVAASFVGYIQNLGASALASNQAGAANLAQATSAVQVATANQVAAQSAVVRAEKEAIAARGTGVQTQMSIQLAEARLAERAATAQLVVAQTGLKTASGYLLGIFGGPAGIAALAVGAAIAFLTLRDNTSTLEKKLGDLADPLDKLTERFDKLNRATQAVTLRALQENIAETQAKVGQMSGAMADKFENDLRNMGAAGADGLMAGLVNLPADTQAALDLVRKTSKDQASGIAVDWKAVADQLRTMPGVTEEMAQALESSQSPVTDLSAVLQKQQQTLAALTAETDKNTASQNQNSAAKSTASAAGQKYIDEQTKALQAAQDKTFTEQADRFILANKDLTDAQIVTIHSLAAAKDAQKKSDDAATKATQDSGSATKKAATEEEARTKALTDLKAQADIAITSATGLAAAYLAGTDKSREFTLQQKVEEALLKTGAGARDKVTAAIASQQNAQDKLAVAKSAYDLGKETDDLIAQAKATLMGADALAAYNAQKALTIALAGKNVEVGSKEYEQLQAATKAQQAAVKMAHEASTSTGIMDRLYPAAKLLKDYTDDQNALNAAMALYPANAGAYESALVKLSSEYEANRNKATIWGQMTEGAIDRIDEAFANMWQSVLNKSGNFMETLKNSFKQFLGEMLHMAITKPIIVRIASSLGIGGLAGSTGSDSGGGILASFTGNGIMSYLNTAKTVISTIGSNFGKALSSGWSSGEGITGGLQNAFSNGADYVKDAITGAFTTGSAAAASTAALTSESITTALSQSSTVYASQFSASAGAVSYDAAASASASAASSGLATLGSVLGYIQGVYTIFQSFQAYGLKGAAVTGGLAAAGAYVGSFFGPIGTAIGFAVGAVAGAFGAGKLFGSGEKYADMSTSAQGTYSSGKYVGTGPVPGWQTNAPKYGAAADAQMDSTVNQFATTLGMLYKSLGNGADVYAYDLMQVRKTSGKYSTTFGATLDNGTGVGLDFHQQFNAADAAAALATNYDDIMGTFLAKAIVSSVSLPEYFKSQFTDFANSWDTTADEVIKAIEGVFTRFNGVNDALNLINVNNLKLDNTGLIAADSILNMVGALADLDVTTASAKDKVDALNTAVGTYYQAFFSADEQFSDLSKSLQNAFGGFGLELPDTRSAYRDMVEDIDVTTGAGQAMFATMMGLASNADAYYTEIDKRAQAAVGAASAAADAASEAGRAATDAWSNYYGLFTSDTQKAADTLVFVNKQFAALGVVLPSTRDGFAAMVGSIDSTTQKGKSLFDSLLGLATNADAAFNIIEANAKAATEASAAAAQAVNDALNLGVTHSFSAVQRAITAQQKAATEAYNATTASLNDMASTASKSISDLTSVSNSLDGALKSLRGSSDDTVKILRAQAKATLQSALATVKAGGSLAGITGLSDALDTVSSNNTDLYSSMEDFARDQGQTANVIDELNQLNGKQLTSAEKSLAGLKEQIDVAKAAYDAQVAAFDKQLAFAQAQVDALNGVDTSVLSVTAAVNAMNLAVVAALTAMAAGSGKTATQTNNETLVESIYRAVLGRESDADGLAYWVNELKTGLLSYDNIAKAIAQAALTNVNETNAAKANAGGYLHIPGYASGGDFGGGLRLVGENGPELEVTGPSRIYNANQTAAMLGAGGNTALVAEVRALRSAVESQRELMYQTTKNTGRAAARLDDIREEGIPTMVSA